MTDFEKRGMSGDAGNGKIESATREPASRSTRRKKRKKKKRGVSLRGGGWNDKKVKGRDNPKRPFQNGGDGN